jgi:chemosensory pili system protein ChpA (sensor histidine kinase/response regulator)
MRTILFIEDSGDQRHLVSLFLEIYGYQVKVANDGIEGLAEARRSKPDLILLDLGMPKMDGFEVMKELRADETVREIPVVVLSAWTAARYREQAEAAGAKAFIAKPFELTDLLAVVQQFVPIA